MSEQLARLICAKEIDESVRGQKMKAWLEEIGDEAKRRSEQRLIELDKTSPELSASAGDLF